MPAQALRQLYTPSLVAGVLYIAVASLLVGLHLYSVLWPQLLFRRVLCLLKQSPLPRAFRHLESCLLVTPQGCLTSPWCLLAWGLQWLNLMAVSRMVVWNRLKLLGRGVLAIQCVASSVLLQ